MDGGRGVIYVGFAGSPSPLYSRPVERTDETVSGQTR